MASGAILIYGAGGHGKVVADIAQLMGYELAGFIDDDDARAGQVFYGAPVLAWSALRGDKAHTAEVALALGDNGVRAQVQARLREDRFTVATLIHPHATIAATARIGEGTTIMAGAVVNPDAVVGEGAILNTGCVVEHDCILGNHVHLSPGVALGGGVQIGARTHLGLGAVALPQIKIGHDVTVGAGAVAHRNVPDGVTVVGVPARVVRKGH